MSDGVARDMLEGVKVLAAASPCPVVAFNLIAGFTTECALKAYLTRDGRDEAVKAVKAWELQHDLEALWKMAVAQGLSIPQSPPAWVVSLSALHNRPFPTRYLMGPAGPIQGTVGPNIAETTSGLVALLQTVQAQLSPP